MEKIYLTRHDLGSLISGTFSLLKPTWKRALTISLVFFVPLALISSFSTQLLGKSSAFVETMTQAFSGGGGAGFIAAAFGIVAVMLAVYFLMMLITVYSSVALARSAWAAISGEALGWKDVMRETFLKKGGKILGWLGLMILLVLGFVIVLGVVIGLPAFLIASDSSLAVPMIALMVILGMAALAGLIALSIYLSFSLTIIAVEDAGPLRAFRGSFRLVKGSFWRILGINLLFGIAIYLVANLAALPFSLTSALLNAFASASLPGVIVIDLITAVGTSVSAIATGLISPLYGILLYADLKVRAGELADTADFSGLDSAMGDNPIP